MFRGRRGEEFLFQAFLFTYPFIGCELMHFNGKDSPSNGSIEPPVWKYWWEMKKRERVPADKRRFVSR